MEKVVARFNGQDVIEYGTSEYRMKTVIRYRVVGDMAYAYKHVTPREWQAGYESVVSEKRQDVGSGLKRENKYDLEGTLETV